MKQMGWSRPPAPARAIRERLSVGLLTERQVTGLGDEKGVAPGGRLELPRIRKGL